MEVDDCPQVLALAGGQFGVATVRRSVTEAITADPHWQQAAESEAGSVREWCRQHGLS